MVAFLNPHFDLPFRLSSGSFACAEQDSYEDVYNCVEAIVRTPQGFRDDSPAFGIPGQEFTELPLQVGGISAIVAAQEPRAKVLISQQIDKLDSLITNIMIEVDQ